MILTYCYRLLPSRKQHRALEGLLESQRQLYNGALEERIGAYRRGVTRTFFDQAKALTEWRRSDPEAAAFPLRLQRGTLRRLDSAYKGFFRRAKLKGGKAGFPRFRGAGRWHSFNFDEFDGIRFDGRALRFKGMPSGLRVHIHRPLPSGSRIRCCVFRRGAKGWTVGFSLDFPKAPKKTEDRCVGVDLGISLFAALSDGGFIPSLRAARRAQRRLRILQRSLARKKRGSRNRRKARVNVARCHAAISRSRSNHLHQASSRLVRDYDVIAVESLVGLTRGTLACDVYDASWSTFLTMLRYKAERAGARLVVVDARYTSQDCSCCGMRVPKPLRERTHSCGNCGLCIDRDLNAARNILHRAGVGPGLQNVAS